MNFQLVPPVDNADTLLDLAFSRARRKSEKKKIFENQKVDIIKDDICKRLDKIIDTFPSHNTLPKFYQKIMLLTLDIDKFRKSLGAVQWARNTIAKLHKQFSSKINGASIDDKKVLANQFYGRISSVLKKIDPELSRLQDFRRILKTYPDIKELFTICLYGFPNVGKSTLLNKLTGTKAQTAAYAFTTKSINAGYFEVNDKKIQVLDVPGTLDRNKMNDIELQAELVLEEVANIIVFVYDISGFCGYDKEQQDKLFEKISSKKNVLIYLSKKDILTKEEITNFDKKHYSLEELKAKIIELAPIKEEPNLEEE